MCAWPLCYCSCGIFTETYQTERQVYRGRIHLNLLGRLVPFDQREDILRHDLCLSCARPRRLMRAAVGDVAGREQVWVLRVS